MPCCVQQEDGQQNCPWRPLIELRNNVESRCNPEHERAEKKIDGEDIHSIPRKPDALAYYAGPNAMAPRVGSAVPVSPLKSIQNTKPCVTRSSGTRTVTMKYPAPN